MPTTRGRRRKLRVMMDESVEENGYEFYFNYEEYPPIGGRGGERFEVFVTRYYDRTQGDGSTRLYDDALTGPHKARGRRCVRRGRSQQRVQGPGRKTNRVIGPSCSG